MEETWLYTKEALEHAQEAAHERAAQVLRERRTSPKPLSLAQGGQLVMFYAKKLPELCKLCAAGEVTWTALVFFKRFYAASSPMEFDPMVMMYTCVHLACKIEELREVTLDKLLEVSGFAQDASMKTKVTDLELELLEGIGFSLLVEPKPGAVLRLLDEERATEARAKAEALVFELSSSSHAVLLYPTSVIVAACWAKALEGEAPVVDILRQHFEDPSDKDAVSRMFQEVQQAIESLVPMEDKGSMQEIAKTARKCQRAFSAVHEERKEQHEAHRKERKRRRNDLKVSPVIEMAELRRKAQALQGVEDMED